MTDAPGGAGSDREDLARMLIAAIWMPIQITLSLIFATGGIFLLLVLGIIFSPLIGLYFLIRRSAGPKENPDETTDSAADAVPPPVDFIRRLLQWGRPGTGDRS